jgi:predicted GIY-YIG superfamily endonuclease
MWYVYILKCNDAKTYIGCTNNLKDRILRHSNGCIEATRQRLPIELFSYFAFNDKSRAFDFEKYLKTGSGRVFLQKRIF